MIGNAVWVLRMGAAVAGIYWDAARHAWRKQLAHTDDPLRIVLVHATR